MNKIWLVARGNNRIIKKYNCKQDAVKHAKYCSLCSMSESLYLVYELVEAYECKPNLLQVEIND